MITCAGATTLARYNAWQNESIYAAASRLDDAARRLDRGAFFKSIHGTLSHILWGDMVWMARFGGTPNPNVGIPDSPDLFPDWEEMHRKRVSFDAVISDWTENSLDDNWLQGELSWFSGAADREITAPKAMLLLHMFNHQTHHRGQVNAMLTAAGAQPDDTDLMLMALGNR